MMKTRHLLLFLSITVGLGFISSKSEGKVDPIKSSKNAISVSGTKFVDSYGRQVIFSGLNYVNKSPEANYTEADSSELYAQFQKWGISCLRLGIIWDGVEPEPGKYNEKYLDAIEKKIQWAAEHNIYVMLDMHQDLYSRKYADGAPLWATLNDNQPHVTGSIWSDAYLLSSAVQRAFDSFWNNKPASDGVGVQDHYINMWRHVAKRFSSYKNVIGYDIMNEPFNGSNANEVMPLLLGEYAKMLVEETGQAPPSEEKLAAMWADEKSRFEVLKTLSKSDKYARIIDAASEPIRQFEAAKLQSFYQRAAESIRQVDTSHIIFLEHSYFCNAGIRSALEPVKDANGKPDKLQAYAPHGYDLLTDTKEAVNQVSNRVELIFNRISETSKRMNLPVLVGEWGAYYGEGAEYISSARAVVGVFERYHFGNTYWSYGSHIGNAPCFKQALVRPYPRFVAESLISYSYDYSSGTFSCAWNENPSVSAPTVIFVPDITKLVKGSIMLAPVAKNFAIQPIDGSSAGYLIIYPSEKTGVKTLRFKILTNG